MDKNDIINITRKINQNLSHENKINDDMIDNIIHSIEYQIEKNKELEFKKCLENELMKNNCYELARQIIKI